MPSACVRETLLTTSAYFTGSVVTNFPSVSYVRECRTVLQILNDLLGAYKLGINVMTDTCKSAHKTNRLLSQIVDGHLLFWHHHQHNVWVKDMLDMISNYVSTLIKDNLEDIAPELCVSPRFENMCRAFDKEFSLCANYPKVWGYNFRQWMKENHSGELIFHVEHACKGRMDVVSMASMAIYWNRNYCVDFLD